MQALQIIETDERRTPLALDLPEQTDFDEWVEVGRRLRLSNQALNWQIGDWWRFGVAHWGDEQTRSAALEIWGVEGETARVYGWVASKFEPVNRLTELSFTHYQRAASLPAEDAQRIIVKAATERLSVRDVQREVQALKASNDTEPAVEQTRPSKAVPSQSARAELTKAYEVVIEFAEALEQLRPLTRREADLLSVAQTFVDEAHANHRPCPDDFDIIFVEKGRLECETHYSASRVTVNRWLIERGKRRLIEARAEFVRFQRDQEHAAAHPAKTVVEMTEDVLYPIAREAAHFLRTSRYGGWRISRPEDASGWVVGTVRKTSDELIAMAERQGFDSIGVRESLQMGFDAEVER